MKRVLFLLMLLPMFCFGQASYQQKKTPASGSNAGNQFYDWWGVNFSGYMGVPFGANATLNRAADMNGLVYFQLSDHSIRFRYNGAWLSFGGGGAVDSTLFFNADNFYMDGKTDTTPISIRYLNTPIGTLDQDSLVVIRPDGTPGAIPSNFAIAADGIISGLTSSISGSNVLVTAGVWRINGVNYHTTGTTTLPISPQDSINSAFDLVYATNADTLGIIHGTFSLTPVIPSVPAGTIAVAIVSITPTGTTVTPPDLSGYVQKGTPYTPLAGQFLVGSVSGDGKLVTDASFKYIYAIKALQLADTVRKANLQFVSDEGLSTHLSGLRYIDSLGVEQEFGWNPVDGAWEVGTYPGAYSPLIAGTTNGLQLFPPSQVGLGGSLSTGTSITAGLNQFSISSGSSPAGLLNFSAGDMVLQTTYSISATQFRGRFETKQDNLFLGVLQTVGGSGTLAFTFTHNTATFTDAIASKGMSYAADYSTNNSSNPRWIPDKNYVDTKVAGGGTVTSITPGVGFLSHTPITTTGTMDVDTASTIQTIANFFPKGDTRWLKSSALHTLTLGRGLTGTSYNTSANITSTLDTTQRYSFVHGMTYSGNFSTPAWANNTAANGTGANLTIAAATYTDNSTAGSTTLGFAFGNAFYQPTFAASNTGVVYTTPATLAILNAPAAGTNVTLSNPLAFYVVAGQSVTGGGVATGTGGSASNFAAAGGTGMNAATTAQLLFAGASTIDYRAVFGGNTSTSVGSGSAPANVIIGSMTVTTAASSTTPMVASLVVNKPGTITLGGSATLTTSTTVYINGQNSVGTNKWNLISYDDAGSGTNNIWGKYGISRFSGLQVDSLSTFSAPMTIVNTTSPQLNVEYDGTHLFTESVASNGVSSLNSTSSINLQIGGTTRAMVQAASMGGLINVNGGLSGTTGAAGLGVTGVYSNSTGTNYGEIIGPTISQSSTASTTALFVTPFFNTPGSGAQLIVDFGKNTANDGGGTHTSYFNINSSGAIVANGNTTVTGNLTLGAAGNALNITEGSNGRVGQTTLVSGTKAITITGLTTSSRAFVSVVSQGGTSTNTWKFAGVCTSNTLTITAITTAGATNTSDTSVINYFVIN